MSAKVDLDLVWKALADPTRRRLLDELSRGPRSTGDLVERVSELSRTGVMKHLDLLEEAGLVLVRREGRVRWNHLNPMPIQRIYDRWVKKHLRGLAASLSSLKDHAEAGAPKRARPRPKSSRSSTRSR